MNEKLVVWLKTYAEKIEENKALLGDLDTAIGDGDHGTNMSRGMQAVIADLEENPKDNNQDLLKGVGMTLLTKVGGASGPLYGSAFLSMSKVIEDKLTSDVVKEGFDSIAKRGKSTLNEKTMLDVWGPVSEFDDLTSLTKEDLENFAAATDAMKATKGRASFLGDRSIGHRDPGSVSSQLLFESAIESGVFK